MKIVLNKDYGGFGYGVAKEYENLLKDNDRTDEAMVEFVETHPDECGDLEVVTIPDEVTDWEINEYDGWEDIIYVFKGKLYHK